MTQLMTVSEMERISLAIAKSGLFGMKTAEQALALMAISQAEGQHPALAAKEYNIIQGRPTLNADAMLARFQRSGGTVKWTEYTDTRVSGVFSHPAGGEIEIDWDMKRAQNANLTNKDVWKKFPRNMLRARCISEGIRTVYPGIVVGTYTPDEVEEFDKPAAQEKKSLKEKLAEKTSLVSAAVDAEIISPIFADIEKAKTEDDLNALAEVIKTLKNGEREAVKEKWVAKRTEIRSATSESTKVA